MKNWPSAKERFNEGWVLAENGCWQWTKSCRNGYPALSVNKRQQGAHRYSYELFVGPIPEGYTIDHLCRNKRCVNPKHLEAVTNRVNVLRGIGVTAHNSRKEKCKHGHEFTPENTAIRKGGRSCRICERTHSRKWIRDNPGKARAMWKAQRKRSQG